jgi:hypothetical protein
MRGEPGGDEGIPATNVEMDWIGLDWIGLDWIGLDWIGLDWIGLDWIGLDWMARVEDLSFVAAHTRFLLLFHTTHPQTATQRDGSDFIENSID